ncbi:hypothetical protein [Streptococcus pneumoniae]|uniref:hypothetical protein n=1 Tax=Streptococcus pneumoniae TaxID=1313 RepID=UPI000B58F160|nr:hypothetical protein [Streptococcus pneumoniae]SNH86714.1 Uncharacterised protein [Streptococcus pneumoniae]
MAKKDFSSIENPALQFISKEEAPQEHKQAGQSIPEGYKANPEYIEKKNRRLQLLMQPSLYKLLKERALEEGTSVNNLIHELLEKVVK